MVAAGVYASLSFAFAFQMSMNTPSLSAADISDFICFAGTVAESPRDASASIVLNDCYGYGKGWKKIDGALLLTPKFRTDLHTDDRVIFFGRARNISEVRNPGEFDLKSYYALNGVVGRIYLRNESDIMSVCHDEGFSFHRSVVEPVRNFMRKRIMTFMEGDVAELARAMIIGERAGIDRQISERFMNTGTIHILSVSGLHVGFLTGMLMMMALLLRIPRRFRFFVIAPLLILYAFVVGMTPSVTRAVIMATVVLFGLFLQRRTHILNSLGFAAMVILVFKPAQLFSPGFQLSFAAVMSITFFYERILAAVRKSYPSLDEKPLAQSIVSVSLLTVAATLGTVPLTAYYFNRISLVSVLANLFIVPLAGVFTTMGFTFIGLSFLSSSLASIYGAATQLVGFAILQINSLLGSISMSSITISDSGLLFASLYFIWLAAVVTFGRSSMRPELSGRKMFIKKTIFATILGADMILFAGLFKGNRDAKVFVLDVGQGDAIYVELPDGKNILIDAGMKFGSQDVGERVIVPFLERRGIKELNYFVITHLHSDHVGGATSVIRSVKVDNFIYPDQLSRSEVWTKTLMSVRAMKVCSRFASAGMILDSGLTYRVYVLHPNPKYAGVGGLAYKTKLNDGSIVLKVCIGKESVLLAGDIEKRVEHDLVGVYGTFLSSNVYKAGHHGSSTSSSPELLERVDPEYAVISVGAGNKFGHPSPDVLNEMARRDIKIWRTDSLGAAYFRIYPDTLELVDWR